jgi:carboxyl-terminal processing protease
MLDDEIGYIRISNFARTTATELQNKIALLEDEGMEKLLLDLRFNPGGLLQAAKEVSELFLEKEDLIVYTKGRLAQQNMSYYATGRYGLRWKDRPLLVLVNGSSASASEILAGAIQDHDVGLVAGQTSFGKGSVQTVFELTDSEALKLTTAKYYTPSGRSIHKERKRNGDPMDHPGDLAEADADGDPEQEEAEIYFTDMGREVHGGGGIAPDLEIEPSLLNDFAVALERDATFFEYTNRYVADQGDVPMDFEVTDRMLEDFYELAQTRENLPEYFEDFELEMTAEIFEENADYVREGIRREVVRRLYGSSQAFQVSLERDGQVWEAVEILREADDPHDLFRIAEEMRQKRLAEAPSEEDAEAAVH